MTTTTINGQKVDLDDLGRVERYAKAIFDIRLLVASVADGPQREARMVVQAMRSAANELEQEITSGYLEKEMVIMRQMKAAHSSGGQQQ